MKTPFTVYEGSEPYLFISYSHVDADKVEPLLRELTDKGFRFWYDEGIAPGSEWPEDVARHLNDAAVVIAVISPNSMNSENCRREINFALSKSKPLLSVVLEKTEMPLGMEMQLSSHQSILGYNFSDWQAFADKITGSPILASCGGRTVETRAARQPKAEQNTGNFAAEAVVKDAKMMEIFSKASELSEKEEYEQELQVLSSGLAVDPENCSLYVKLGRCYRRLGMPQKALECYEKAKSINPDDPTIYGNIGAVYMASGQAEKGKPFYEQAIAMVENDPLSVSPGDRASLYGNCGRCIGLLGDLEGARKMLIKARDLGYAEKYLIIHCADLHISLDTPSPEPAIKTQPQPVVKPAEKPQPKPAAGTQTVAAAEQKPAQPKGSHIVAKALGAGLGAAVLYLLYQLLSGGIK